MDRRDNHHRDAWNKKDKLRVEGKKGGASRIPLKQSQERSERTESPVQRGRPKPGLSKPFGDVSRNDEPERQGLLDRTFQ